MRAKHIVRGIIVAAISAAGGGVALLCCVSDSGNNIFTSSDGGTNEGSTTDGAVNQGDGTIGDNNDGSAPPATGFTMQLAHTQLIGDQGDTSPSIGITVNRAVSFNNPIAFTFVAPSGFTPPPQAANTGNGGTSSSFTVTIGNSVAAGDYQITVTGTDNTSAFVVNQTLNVHVGTLLDVSSGSFTAPSYASALVVKAWGAGGGAGGMYGGEVGGMGGGGGFAMGTIPVTKGQNFQVFVGTPGMNGVSSCGAGGGGYSALCPSPNGTCFVIAGGGGGGGGANNVSGPDFAAGIAGGAGGGLAGQDSTLGQCGGSGGSQTSGGYFGGAYGGVNGGGRYGADGGALQGGAGYLGQADSITIYAYDGGVPGGGPGGCAPGEASGGGGGGGYYGGGGGSGPLNGGGGGGGGGSGFIVASALDGGVNTQGNGIAPPSTNDPDYQSGASYGASDDGGVATGGLVVVRVAKPW